MGEVNRYWSRLAQKFVEHLKQGDVAGYAVFHFSEEEVDELRLIGDANLGNGLLSLALIEPRNVVLASVEAQIQEGAVWLLLR